MNNFHSVCSLLLHFNYLKFKVISWLSGLIEVKLDVLIPENRQLLMIHSPKLTSKKLELNFFSLCADSRNATVGPTVPSKKG